jgi:polyhydroxybutyrate depolymerase
MKQMKSVLILSAWLAAGCMVPARAAEPLGPGRYERTLDFGGVKRTYVIRVPKQAAAGKPLPVVVVLHGWTGSAKAAEIYTNMAKAAEDRGYIAVFPDGLGKVQGWNVGWIDLSQGNKADDAGFVNALLNESEKIASVDRQREYVCGHSNGAFLTHLVASQYGSRLAAGAAVAGTIGFTGKVIPDPKTPISMLLIHGKEDPTVGYDPSFKATLRGISAPESARWWAKAIGAGADPVQKKSADGNLITDSWMGPGGREVQLISIVNGKHDWPGGLSREGRESLSGLDAAKAILDFFDAHKRS